MKFFKKSEENQPDSILEELRKKIETELWKKKGFESR